MLKLDNFTSNKADRNIIHIMFLISTMYKLGYLITNTGMRVAILLVIPRQILYLTVRRLEHEHSLTVFC